MTAVKKLREHAPPHLTEHMRLVSKHAKALQLSQDSDRDYDDKAKAYTHNFEAASRAIKAALSTLRKELQTGHNHDVGILKSSKASASSTLTSGQASAANKVKGLKHEGCPTKRAEEKADEDKKKAKRARDDEKNKKICPLNTTWDDMDIHKSVPKYGAELRNAWDKARARWVSRDNAYKAAIKAHETSIVKHEEKIALQDRHQARGSCHQRPLQQRSQGVRSPEEGCPIQREHSQAGGYLRQGGAVLRRSHDRQRQSQGMR